MGPGRRAWAAVANAAEAVRSLWWCVGRSRPAGRKAAGRGRGHVEHDPVDKPTRVRIVHDKRERSGVAGRARPREWWRGVFAVARVSTRDRLAITELGA